MSANQANEEAQELDVPRQSRSQQVARGRHSLTTPALARRTVAGERHPGDTVDPELLGTAHRNWVPETNR
jgi:hypothetical protein